MTRPSHILENVISSSTGHRELLCKVWKDHSVERYHIDKLSLDDPMILNLISPSTFMVAPHGVLLASLKTLLQDPWDL